MVQDRSFISLIIITDELENTIECYDTKVYENSYDFYQSLSTHE